MPPTTNIPDNRYLDRFMSEGIELTTTFREDIYGSIRVCLLHAQPQGSSMGAIMGFVSYEVRPREIE